MPYILKAPIYPPVNLCNKSGRYNQIIFIQYKLRIFLNRNFIVEINYTKSLRTILEIILHNEAGHESDSSYMHNK